MPLQTQRRTHILHFVTSFLFVCGLHAAAPTLDYIFPLAFQRGSTAAVTLGGKLDPWPVSVWADCSGVTFRTETNNGKISVETSKEAPLGPHLLRVYDHDGVSAPRCFVITSEQDVMEKEPNDSLQQAQVIEKLPVVITGRLEKSGDVDSFAITVPSGKWLVARVDAFSLGSPVDAVLHLFDGRGVRVAFNHDSAQSLDPLLAYKVATPGRHVVQVAGFAYPPAADVRFAGSAATIYRLSITDGPVASHAFPAGVQRGCKAPLRWVGWNLPQSSHDQPFDASEFASSSEQVLVDAPGPDNRLPIFISDVPEQVETESKTNSEREQLVSPPCAISGRIAPAGDEDRFRFAAQKGERLEIRLQAASLGSPLHGTLKLSNVANQPVASEETSGPEPKLTWTAPANGSYLISVSDLFRRGGDDYVYRLSIVPPKPDFKVAVADHAFRLEPGKTNEIKVEVSRLQAHTNSLIVSMEGLPEGVTAKPTEVPAKGGEVKLALIAAAEATPTNRPVRILVSATDGSEPRERAALFDLKGKESPGNRLINETAELWLTVLPKPAPAKPAEEEK